MEENDEDDGAGHEYASRRDWLDDLGAGAVAALGAGAFVIAVVFMALMNQLGGAFTGAAATADVEEVSFEAPVAEITVVPPREGAPAWLLHAEAFEAPAGTPLMAIVVLDDGKESHAAMRALDWNVPLSFAIAADFGDSPSRVKQVRRAKREAMALLPFGYGDDFGRDPNVLRRGLSEQELLRRLRWHLARTGEGIVGAVDAQAGDIVRDIVALRTLGAGLAAEGMLMLDSRSDSKSLIAARMRPMGVPVGRRTTRIYRDALPDEAFMALTDAERHAFTWGTAIVLVEAGTTSLDILADWMRTRSDSIAIAPISHVIRRLRRGPQYATN